MCSVVGAKKTVMLSKNLPVEEDRRYTRKQEHFRNSHESKIMGLE